MAGEAERRGGKAGDGVERQPHHLAERVVGLTRMPLGAVIGERHLAKADPGHHAADKARLLGQRQERVERAAAHQAKVARVERDRRVGHPVEHAIKGGRREPLEKRLALAAAANGIDHVRLLLGHRPAHLGEEFGRVLQVGVDDQHLLARAQVEPGGQRELVAVVA